MDIFVYVATLVFLFLSLIWANSSWFNVFLKLSFIVLLLWGGFLSLTALGYIISV